MRQVNENTMTFNSSRRIAGKGKGEVIVVEDPNFDRKLDLITEGGRPFVKEHLLTKWTRIRTTRTTIGRERLYLFLSFFLFLQ